MAFGIISIIIGVIIFIVSLFNGITTVMQQQVQHIDYAIAAIFLVGGMLLLKLDNNKKEQIKYLKSLNTNFANFAKYYYGNEEEDKKE